MVREIRIYFEGHRRLRSGFHAFLQRVIEKARGHNIRFRLVPGEGQVVRRFLAAVRSNGRAFSILLIDSEGPAPSDARDVVRHRGNWQPSRDVSQDEVHLMVQLMEAWFLADRPALEAYYRQGFRPKRLPGDPTNVEAVPKDDVIEGLEAATQDTQKGKYHKTRHAPDLLAAVDVAAVRQAAPHCDRLFRALERAITQENQQSTE